MKKGIPLLLLIFLIAIGLVSFFTSSDEKEEITIPKNNLHKAAIQPLLGAKGKYSVVVENLKTGEKESIYGDKVYEAGSLYKLWVMAEAFNQIKNGNLSKDEVLSDKISVLNKDFKISTESAELTEGTIELTVQNALKQMITISHNYAALLLTKKIKLSNVAKFLKTNGLNSSHVGGNPISTADDIALFLKKLYKGELNNAQYTQEMLDLLKAQKLNEKLPKYLPKGTIIAHKTGELEYLSHDAGIVYSENNNYIIVVLSDSISPAGANERISQISKSVFNYFQLEIPIKPK